MKTLNLGNIQQFRENNLYGLQTTDAMLQENRTIISGEKFKTSKPFLQKTGLINSLITATFIIKLNIFSLKLLQYF
jgi:hypothetical protein